jgi:hypothetical protein
MFNAVCCHNRGHRPDSRSRGNLKFGSDGEIGGNCYNCGFKFKFDGLHISDSFESWLGWLGIERGQIQAVKIGLLARKVEGAERGHHSVDLLHNPSWPSVDLPGDAEPIEQLLEQGCDDQDFLTAVDYLANRGTDLVTGYSYSWSNSTKNQLNKRIVIPFLHKGRIVGWTARYAGSPPGGVPRYWNSSVPAGYLFNQDVLGKERHWVLVCEGPFDAIAVQGVSALGSTMSYLQIQTLINSQQRPVILPDRQRANQHLIDLALNFGWGVSFPDWEGHIKDAADACKAYGQIYTITSALQSITHNPIEIGIKRKMFQG